MSQEKKVLGFKVLTDLSYRHLAGTRFQLPCAVTGHHLAVKLELLFPSHTVVPYVTSAGRVGTHQHECKS